MGNLVQVQFETQAVFKKIQRIDSPNGDGMYKFDRQVYFDHIAIILHCNIIGSMALDNKHAHDSPHTKLLHM